MKVLPLSGLAMLLNTAALADGKVMSVADFKLDQKSFAGIKVRVEGGVTCDTDQCQMTADDNSLVTLTFTTKSLPRATEAQLLHCSIDNEEPCRIVVTGVGNRQNIDFVHIGEEAQASGYTSAVAALEDAESDLDNVTEIVFDKVGG